MPDNLFAYILRYSKRQQLVLVALIFCAFPFYYFSLNLPKTIINDAINGSQFPAELSFSLLGTSVSFGSFSQIHYLFILCMIFLCLVIINGGIKYFINVYRGVLGERMLRRLRFQLVERIMKFPLSRFKQTSQGELVSMVNQETEPLAGFIGECFSLPLFQGGMMITILIFMFVQDWKLGIAAIALYPLQSWLIPKLQNQVNLLNRQRIVQMRKLAENLTETVSGINEIRVNNSDEYLKSCYSEQLGSIFDTRVQIFRKKYFIKFLNSFIGQITPFLFFLLGGFLVINGELTFGALVAVLAAYKDLSSPWKEMLAWYQMQADARMKFSLIMKQFSDRSSITKVSQSQNQKTTLSGSQMTVKAEQISLKNSDESELINAVSLTFNPASWTRITGSANSGKTALGHLMAGLEKPSSGKILVNDSDVLSLPDSISSQIFGYCGYDSYLFSTSISENLVFALKQLPTLEPENKLQSNSSESRRWFEEARLSGNSHLRSTDNWLDYTRAGVADDDDLLRHIGSVLRTVNLEDELVRTALSKSINENDYPDLVTGLLHAREVFRLQISEENIALYVEPLDPDKYNHNASVAENLLFGTATDEDYSTEKLAQNSYVRTLLKEHDLDDTFQVASLAIANTMVEIFSGLPPNHEFYYRYNLVNAEEVTTLGRITSTIDRTDQLDLLEPSDKTLLESLPFRLITGRHRLGIINQDHQNRILMVRKAIIDHHDNKSPSKINFFKASRYSDSSTIGDNIIFGKIAFARRGAADLVYRQIYKVLQQLDLIPQLLAVGLSAPTGLAGSLLPLAQRQKILLGRALLKRPGFLVINEGLSALDSEDIQHVLRNIRSEFPAMSLLWIDSEERFDDLFDHSVSLSAGSIARTQELTETGPANGDGPGEAAPALTRTASSVQLNEKIQLVSRIPIFRSLDNPMLQIIGKTSQAVDIAQGERLFSQGDDGDALYVIIEGNARIIMNYSGVEVPIAELGTNDVIGELAVFSSEPRTASVEAVTNLVTLRLDREDILDIIQSNGDVGYQLLQVITSRLRDASRHTSAESWKLPAPARVDV